MRTYNNTTPGIVGDEPIPYYKEMNKAVYVVVPSFRVKTNLAVSELSCKIFNDTNLIYTYPIKLLKDRANTITPILKINLSTFKEQEIKTRIHINCEAYNLYDSGKDLWRNYILFYNGQEVLEDHLLPGNYFLYTTDIDSFSQIPSRHEPLPFKNLYYLHAARWERLQRGNRLIDFSKPGGKAEIFFTQNENSPASLYYQGQKYSVLTGELYLKFDRETDIYSYKLCYGDFSFPLTYFMCPKGFDCPLEQAAKRSSILVPLEDYAPTKIEIYNCLENKIEDRIRVVKCPGLKISFDKALYYNNDKFAEVTASLGKESVQRQFLISEGEASLEWNGVQHNVEGSLLIPLPVMRIKLDNGNFTERFEQDLWAQNISKETTFTVSLPVCSDYEIIDDCNRHLTKKGDNTFCLGSHVHSKYGQRYKMSIFLKLSNNQRFKLFTIFRQPQFTETPFSLAGRKFLWKPAAGYIGPENVNFEISFSQRGVVLKTIVLANRQEDVLISELKPGEYSCLIKTLEGFELHESKVMIGNPNELRFLDTVLKIGRVQLLEGAKWQDIEPFYIDRINLAGSINGFDIYTGEIFIEALGQKIYFDRMADDTGELKQINPVRLDLLNEENCTLLPGAHPENLNQILGQFTLDKNGVITILTDSNKVKYIKRFAFEVIPAGKSQQSD